MATRRTGSAQSTRRIALVGPRLKQLRTDRGLTIKDVATVVGLAESTVGLLEKGTHDPSLGTMLALVRFYDLCSVEEILGEGRLGTAVLLEHPHHRP